jgi:hypothetical protein
LAKRIYIRLTKDILRALIALPVGIHHPIGSRNPKAPGLQTGLSSRQFTFELKHSVRLPGFLPLRACWLTL